MRCIDADTLEKILEKIPAADIKNMGGQAYVLVKLSQVFNVIDNQPTIEPRKKGKWIDTTQGDHYKCSCCGTRAAFWFNEENSSGWEKDMSEWLSDFCPNCGARMEENEE